MCRPMICVTLWNFGDQQLSLLCASQLCSAEVDALNGIWNKNKQDVAGQTGPAESSTILRCYGFPTSWNFTGARVHAGVRIRIVSATNKRVLVLCKSPDWHTICSSRMLSQRRSTRVMQKKRASRSTNEDADFLIATLFSPTASVKFVKPWCSHFAHNLIKLTCEDAKVVFFLLKYRFKCFSVVSLNNRFTVSEMKWSIKTVTEIRIRMMRITCTPDNKFVYLIGGMTVFVFLLPVTNGAMFL